MSKYYKLIKLSSDEDIWLLPESTIEKLGLKEKNMVALKWGSNTTHVKIKKSSKLSESDMGLPASTLAKLGIPAPFRVKLLKTASDQFRLGPVIGILTFAAYVPDKLHYYTRWTKYHKQGGLLYIFSGKDIDVERRLIRGYYLSPSEAVWSEGIFPFPDAVIDRCYPNKYKYHEQLESVIGPNKIFNKRNLISKSDFFKALKADKELQRYVPETKLFRSPSDLTDILNKYNRAFLKPIGSMKGKGIIIATQKPQKIEFVYYEDGNEIKETCHSPNYIYTVMKNIMTLDKKYIVQQAIDSVEYQGGPLSFRVCPMKNGQNQWVIPGLVPLGTLGSGYTTNYSSGGTSLPLKEIYEKVLPLLPYSKEEFISLLCNLSSKTALALEKEFGLLADLGIDLVIDKNGLPWLLEANGNPAKIAAYVQNDFPAWKIATYKYPLDFASYLAGFK